MEESKAADTTKQEEQRQLKGESEESKAADFATQEENEQLKKKAATLREQIGGMDTELVKLRDDLSQTKTKLTEASKIAEDKHGEATTLTCTLNKYRTENEVPSDENEKLKSKL